MDSREFGARGSYNVTRGTIYVPSVHDWNSPKFSAFPGDRCAAAATEDDVTSVVPVVEFIALESVDSCASAALDDEAPVADAPAPVPGAFGAEFDSLMPVEFKVQLCLDELVHAATARLPCRGVA